MTNHEAAAPPRALAVEPPGRRSRKPADGEPDPLLVRIGDRLRLLRTRRGMTRRLLAAQSGISERFIAQMEAGAGNGSILLLRAIADALGVRIQALLAEDDERPAELARLDQLLAGLAAPQLQEALALLAARFTAAGDDARSRRIALVGLRGAGKSSLGRGLAERRGVPFVELDREIEHEAGTDLREIFELHGQRGFRRLERTVLQRLVTTHAGCVIAAGGSIVAEPATYDLLLARCLTVWVRALPEEHMQRVIGQGDLRPMQDNRQAMQDLRAILASRESLYARADLRLDTSGRSLEQSLNELLRLLDG
jgi:XRE family aerobic/anaerobic benzoate catabolism transcriptional regulator